jgi:ABC-type transport system involved in multi-copper enzyme maturation permease subunit
VLEQVEVYAWSTAGKSQSDTLTFKTPSASRDDETEPWVIAVVVTLLAILALAASLYYFKKMRN